MRLLTASFLLLAAMGQTLAADGVADGSRRVRVLHLTADGDVFAEVVPEGADATLVLAPQTRQPSPPARPMAPTLAPATPIGVPLTSSLTLALGADRQPASALARMPAPCAPLGAAPLQPTCGAGIAAGSQPLLDTTSLSAGFNFYRPGAVYSVTVAKSGAMAPPWTVPGYSLEMARAPVPTLGGVSPNLESISNSLTVAGVWSLNALGALSISGSLGESLLRSPLLPQGRSQDRAALGVSLSHGTLSGGLVGHVNSQSQPGLASAGWAGLDLGLTWRTPWSGQFVFGARNLVTYGDEALLPDPAAAKALDESRERTPYVEYRQDF